MTLKLGILGLSEGNGHPYSWSAIFNGYNPEAMDGCGFPAIPNYLVQQKWPESQIPDARVTSIWTQNQELSKKVAKASLIPNVVQNPTDMIGSIDGLLLARDDAESHLGYAKPFLEAGLPIYIDKPIALSAEGLEDLYALERYPGQIFTCSALRYSSELKLTSDEKAELGEIRQIIATTPKSWEKYAVHIIEPVLNLLNDDDRPIHYSCLRDSDISTVSTLSVAWESGIQTSFFAIGDGLTPISLRVCGTKGWKELTFSDSFSAFKKALETFVDGIQNRTTKSPKSYNVKVVNIIEQGRL